MEDEIRIFGLAASLRRDSYNQKLLAEALKYLQSETVVEVQRAKLTQFEMPLYNADIRSEQGFPEAATQLGDAIDAADGLIIATPEYNHSISGALKNAIDWLSRFRPNPFRDCHILLMSAAPSRVGGLRGLGQTRVPLQALGAHVYPRVYGLSHARQAFDESGTLVEAERRAEIHNLIDAFIEHVRRCGPKRRGGE